MPTIRLSSERLHTKFGWLDSWHSFSFGNHFDPAWVGFGPLRVINDDTVSPKSGFGMHPHRDMEIITIMVNGELQHSDSMGNTELLRFDEVQRMSAGKGLVHSEQNASDSFCRFLQIWIEPATRGTPPDYEQKQFDYSNGWASILDPNRKNGAMSINRNVRLWRSQFVPNKQFDWPTNLDSSKQVWIQMIDGSLQIPWLLQNGDGVGLSYPEELSRGEAGDQGADVLFFELT
jgi:redox-sensitive bicupin YhaK (pirin superfamily)